MAMDRETLQREKEKSAEQLERRRAAAPVEQLDAAVEQNRLLTELLEVERESLSALRSIKSWVTFFGILTIINLVLTLIALLD